jgi:hypothetical protein
VLGGRRLGDLEDDVPAAAGAAHSNATISRRAAASQSVTADLFTSGASAGATRSACPTIQTSMAWINPKRSASGRNEPGASSSPASCAERMRTSSSHPSDRPVATSMTGRAKASTRFSRRAEPMRCCQARRSRRSLSRSLRSVTSVPIVHVSTGRPTSSAGRRGRSRGCAARRRGTAPPRRRRQM